MEEIIIKDTLKITKEQENDAVVCLALEGYLDTYNAPDFQSFVNSLIESGADSLIFDLGGLSYISSTGIGAFTSFQKRLKQMKRGMVLFNLQRKVMEVLELLGFTGFFAIMESRKEALSSIEGKTGDGAEKKSESLFPLVFSCPHCGKKLKTSKPGKFRCSGCGGVVRVGNDGSVSKGK